MVTLKEKINYITNQFSAGKPAITGEPSNEFLIGVINELASDESNYAEFKDSIPAIHKAAMEEINVASPDSKHLLVSSMLKNSGITTTLKDENITQKPVFVEFLLDKANKEGDDSLNKDVAELMSHAFDDNNKRIEVSSLLAVTHKFITEAEVEDDSVISRYVASKNFSGDEYAKFCGATLAFNKLQDSFNYELTENQLNMMNESIIAIENFKNVSLLNPNSKINTLVNEAEEKYAKSFFSNDLDVEAQLHKVRSEESLAESAGMISGYDIGSPIKDNINEQNKIKSDQEKYDLMMYWADKYNKYINDLPEVRIMTSGDKFKKRFEHHGFAPSTANIFGDSIVSCDRFGDPTVTLWNISPLTGSMKLSREVRYDDAAVSEKAFAIAALNARRQGWDKVFLNHPGPDAEAKLFIENSFKAMITLADYSFEQINVPRRYQHVLDKLIQESLTGAIKNDAKVSDELRNAAAVNPEPPKKDIETPDEPAQDSAKQDINAPKADSSTPDHAPTDDVTSDESIKDDLDSRVDNNPDTVIPNAFDDDKLSFDIPKEGDTAPVPELDDFEEARLAEIEASNGDDNHFDDLHLDNNPHVKEDQTYIPVNETDEKFDNHNFDQTSEIDYTLPDELRNDLEASIKGQDESTPTKPNGHRKIKFGS